YQWFFHPVWHITGKENSDNNYAQGHCTIDREIIDLILDRIHKLASNFRVLLKKKKNLEKKIFVFHIFVGETDSGFTSYL
ncbi:hypothetical protein DBR06_SOUSAS6810092, partial [Sousa chinensis]